MNRIVKCFALLLITANAYAWDSKDFKDEALSPFTTSARNVVIAGAGLTIGVLLFEDSIVDYTQADLSNDKPLGSFSKFGDLAGQVVPNALYAITQMIGSAAYDDPIGNQRAVGMLKATLYSSGVTTVLKYSIREPRPGNSRARNSFPSGHTTTAFAFGGYVYEEHGWKYGVPALALAAFSGVSRINDNRHYLHDVLAGMTIGLAYGIGISKIDKQKRTNQPSESSITVVPIYDQFSKGLSLVADF